MNSGQRSNLKVQIYSDKVCKIETGDREYDTNKNMLKSKNSINTINTNMINDEYGSNKSAGSLELSKTVSNLSVQTMRISKNSMGNSMVNIGSSNNLNVNFESIIATKISSLFNHYSSNKNDLDNIMIDDEKIDLSKEEIVEIEKDSVHVHDISSESIIHVNPEKKAEISNRSIFYTPSTICNYYEASNEVTPNKNFEGQNGFKLNFRNLNFINVNNVVCNTSHSNYDDNITENSENIVSSSRNNNYNIERDRKTPIKYVKAQLKSGEKEKENTTNNKLNPNKKSPSSCGAPSPFSNIFKINSKTIDGSLSAIAKEIKKTFNISELEIDEKILTESNNRETLPAPLLNRKNLNYTFNQIKDINNNVDESANPSNISSYVNKEKVVQIKAPFKNENFSFDISNEQKHNNLCINVTSNNDNACNVTNTIRNNCVDNNSNTLLDNTKFKSSNSNQEELIKKISSNLMKYNIHPDAKSYMKKSKSKQTNSSTEKRVEADMNSIHSINSADAENSVGNKSNINLLTHITLENTGDSCKSKNKTKNYNKINNITPMAINILNKNSPKVTSVTKYTMTTQPSSNKSKTSTSQKKNSNTLNLQNTVEDLSDFDVKSTITNPHNNINNNQSKIKININKIVIQPRQQTISNYSITPNANLNKSKSSSLEKNVNKNASINQNNRKFLDLFKLYTNTNKNDNTTNPSKKVSSNSATRCNTFLSYANVKNKANSRGGSRGSSNGSKNNGKPIEICLQIDQKSNVFKCMPTKLKPMTSPNNSSFTGNNRKQEKNNSNKDLNNFIHVENENIKTNKCYNLNSSNMSNASNKRNNFINVKNLKINTGIPSTIDKMNNKLPDNNSSNQKNLNSFIYVENEKSIEKSIRTEKSINTNKTNNLKNHRINNNISYTNTESNKSSVVSILKQKPKVINNFSNYTKTKSSSSINSNIKKEKEQITQRTNNYKSIKSLNPSNNLNNQTIFENKKYKQSDMNCRTSNVMNFTIFANKDSIKKQIVSSKINYLVGDEDSVLMDD